MKWTVAGVLFFLELIENVPAIEWQIKQQQPFLHPLQPVWPPLDHSWRVFLACSGIPFVTRDEWGARPPRDPPKRLSVQPVRLLFVHHTTEDECLDFASCSAKMRYWQDFHMDTRGWDDLGYSFLIGGDGRVYVSRGWDRSGRHTFGYNDVALAVSFMGDFSRRLPSPAAMWALHRLIQCGLAQGKIHPSYTLHGHRDANCGTTCPGDALYRHIRQWRHYGGRFKKRICPPRNDTQVPCIPIVSRSEWGARPWRQRMPLRPSRQAQRVFIHHTVGRNCYDMATCADRMRSYQNYHMDGRNWWDIGYNFVVGGDGRVYEGRGFGVEGAHTLGHNRDSIGIALTGDFRNTRPSDKMLVAAQRLIECGVKQGYISPNYRLHGHRDARCSESPGTILYAIIKTWPHYAGRLESYICERPCIPIVSRSQWGARPWRQRRPLHPNGQAQHVFIAHTAGRNCSDMATCADRMRSYQYYHMEGRKWWDIGYSFVVGGDGRVYEGRGFGVESAHTKGYNRGGISIALVGDFRNTRPSDNMLAAAQRLIACGVRQGYISPDYQLHGHRDAICTESPGTALYEIIKTWPHYAGRLEGYICETPCINIVPRSQWGARPWRQRRPMHPIQAQRVFIAHTVGRNCYDFATCADRMRNYQNYHMDTHKWWDIGYNFVVGGDGRVYEGRGFGVEGAHTLGHNADGLGIALTGDFRYTTPSEKMLTALQRLIACGVKQGYISPDYSLHGHRDATCTESPGAVLYAIIKTWPHYAGRLESYVCEAPCIPIVPRSQWGARLWRERRPIHPSRPVQHVFIAHTVGRNCYDVATCADRMRSYQDYHMDTHKWSDIGYNFVVGGDGRVYEGRGFGVEGTHTLGHNRDSIGIALTGDFRYTTPSEKMLTALQRLIACGVKKGYISPDYQLHGHRDATCTESPGAVLYAIIKTWPHYVGRLNSYVCGNKPKGATGYTAPSRMSSNAFLLHLNRSRAP